MVVVVGAEIELVCRSTLYKGSTYVVQITVRSTVVQLRGGGGNRRVKKKKEKNIIIVKHFLTQNTYNVGDV